MCGYSNSGMVLIEAPPFAQARFSRTQLTMSSYVFSISIKGALPTLLLRVFPRISSRNSGQLMIPRCIIVN